MNDRKEVAERIASFIRDNHLDMAGGYGGFVTFHKNHFVIDFAKIGTLTGKVRVYGPRFIQLTFETSGRQLPKRCSKIFASEANVVDFIDKAFITQDIDRAMAIPVRS